MGADDDNEQLRPQRGCVPIARARTWSPIVTQPLVVVVLETCVVVAALPILVVCVEDDVAVNATLASLFGFVLSWMSCTLLPIEGGTAKLGRATTRCSRRGRDHRSQRQRLKLVVRAGTGVETIDIKACTAAGIVVMNTPGQNSTAVAELCFGQMLTLARGWWMGNPGTELRGKTIGLIKYGYIAKRMRAIARGFGMTVMAYDPYIDHTVLVEDGVICAESMEQLFSLCDYVSIHTPHTRVTFSLLSMMKFGATLVNSTRHEAVDQDAVTRMLEIRPDFKFAADVPPGNFRYLEQHYNQRVCFSAIKMGAQTEEANFACGVAALTQVVNFFMKNDRCHQMFE
ncbi:3-phosphoglycerate dehydrogenase [Pelomyxa schiedti]|nr:3-phosphoglycerate dehydrogenase [Pelomyxa schiedti]